MELDYSLLSSDTKLKAPTAFVPTPELRVILKNPETPIDKIGFLVRGLSGPEQGQIKDKTDSRKRQTVVATLGALLSIGTNAESKDKVGELIIQTLFPSIPDDQVRRVLYFTHGIVEPEFPLEKLIEIANNLNKKFHQVFVRITDKIDELSGRCFELGE